MAGQKSYGIHQPSPSGATPSPTAGAAQPSRSSNIGSGSRFDTGGPGGKSGGLVDATTQSVGVGRERPILVPSTAPRTYRPPDGILVEGGGKRTGGQVGDQGGKVARVGAEEDRQIGSRRRSGTSKPLRDAKGEISGQQELEVPRSGDVQRESEGPPGGKPSSSTRRSSSRRREERAETELEETRRRKLVILEKETKGKRRYRDFERKPIDGKGEEEPYSPSNGSVSESEAEVSTSAEGVLDGYRKWLKENDLSGLSIAQAGAHLVLQMKESGTKLGAYMMRMLEEPTGSERKERQRAVLPLPILSDSRKEVLKLIASGDYKRLAGTWKDKQQMKGGKVEREMRRVGLLIWHLLLCCGLNFQWTGGKSVGSVCFRDPTKVQKRCLDHLWESAKVFLDDRSEVKEKLLKVPNVGDWSSKLDGVRISYQGETVEKARDITLDQIMPGLPPEGYGGKIQLADLCEGEVKELLLHPEKCMLQGVELPPVLPRPRVMATDEEWDRICGARVTIEA